MGVLSLLTNSNKKYMKDFRRQNGNGAGRNEGFERREPSNDFRAPRRDFDNRGGFNKYQGDRGSSTRNETMHKAVCSDCNKSCEVPFAPNGNKPVYCNDCFGKKKGGSFEKRDFAPRGPIAHESKLQSQPRDTRIDEIKSQIDSMSTKLDRMMKVLLENISTAEKSIEKKVEEVDSKKVIKAPAAVKKVASVAKKTVAKVVAKAKPVTKKKK